MRSTQQSDASESAGTSSSTSAPASALSALRTRDLLLLSVLWFALNFQSAALLPILIPTQLVPLVAGAVGSAEQAGVLGWFSALGALIALLVPPLAGALSDHTGGAFGRRRPYISLGALVLVGGTLLLALPGGIALLLVGFIVLQLGSNIATAGYQGLIPDIVPEHQRGAASGYMGLMTVLGNAGSLAVAGVLLGAATSGAPTVDVIQHGSALYYVLTGVVLVAGTALTLLGVHETPLEALRGANAVHAQVSRLRRFAADWIEPWRQSNFLWVFLTRGFVMMGLTLFQTFIVYYFAFVAHIANFVQTAAVLALLALLGAVTSALWLGIVSDRIGRVALVCGATACMALASLAFVLLPDGFPLWPLGLLFGVGFGAYTSVDWALAVDVLPLRDAAGKDMGLWSIASTLPAVLAPLLGALAINLASFAGDTALGYRVVFALAVVFMLAGAVCIVFVRDSLAARGAPVAPSDT
jgi:MFS family permease